MLDSVILHCPFCGERIEAVVDPSAGEADYLEGCPVCCREIHLHLHTDPEGRLEGLDADRGE